MGSSRLRELAPTRSRPNASPPKIARRCGVRIDVHESKDRAKDASPGASESLGTGCTRFVACADGVPLLGDLRTSAVVGAPVCSDGCRYTLTDQPRPTIRRSSAKSTAFPMTGMPFTASARRSASSAKGSIPPAFVMALSLTPPTRSGGAGVLVRALQGHGAITRGSVTGSREQTPL